MAIIDSFKDKYAFLSNFAPVEVAFEFMMFPTVENAFQAAKTLDRNERFYLMFCTPGQAKRAGRKFKLRPDWEDIKLSVMEELLRQKFNQEPFKDKLLATGEVELVEGNSWNDVWWGVCNGVGENHLGKLLMNIRDELRHKE